MLTLVVVIVFLLVLIYIGLKLNYTFWNRRGVSQLYPNLLFGSLFENFIQRKSFAEIIKENYDAFRNKRYYGMYLFHQPVLLVKDPELIKRITVKEFTSFTDHQNHARKDVDPLWSRNVFSMMGEKWHEMRSTLTPAFTSSKMRFMFPLINNYAENFARYFLDKNSEVVVLEMKDTCTRATNDMIASCAFGVQCDSLRDHNNEFYVWARKAFDFTGFVRKMTFYMFSACPKVMRLIGMKVFSDDMANFFRTIISQTIKLRLQTGMSRPDIIHLLLQAREGLLRLKDDVTLNESFASPEDYASGFKRTKKRLEISDEDITAQALVFCFGGFDTTSYLMIFLAYELAMNQVVQMKLRMEVDETIDCCSGSLTYEALQGMKYLDMVVSETLRKWPPAAITDRLCNKDFLINPKYDFEQSLLVKSGTIVWIPIFGIHRDASIYPNPDRFDPERFNTKNRAHINSSTYLPFGLGPRNCIGSRFALMENKAIFFHLLRNFEIIPVQNTQNPLKICRRNMNISVNGELWLGFKNRSYKS